MSALFEKLVGRRRKLITNAVSTFFQLRLATQETCEQEQAIKLDEIVFVKKKPN